MSIRRNSRLGVVTRDQSMPGVWTLWISIRDHPLWERYFCYDCRYIPNSSWAGMYGTIWSTGKKLLGSTDARFRSSTGSDCQAPEFFGPPPRKRTWKHEHGPWKREEFLLEIIILYPKKSWKQPFPPPDGLVWCPPARATTRVVSCAIWLISSAEETWSTWRFFGLRSMAFEAPWRSSSTRISIIITAMYWQTKSSEAVLGLCSLFLDVLDVSWNEWEYLPFWCQLEQDLVHQQHQYSDRWLFVSATSLCWIFTNKLTSQKDCEKRLEFI